MTAGTAEKNKKHISIDETILKFQLQHNVRLPDAAVCHSSASSGVDACTRTVLGLVRTSTELVLVQDGIVDLSFRWQTASDDGHHRS